MVVADAPLDVIATPSDSQVILTWGVPYDNGSAITDYLIERTTDQITWTPIAHSASIIPKIIATGLTNKTTYYFRVAAINGSGTSSYSTIVSAMPEFVEYAEYCSVKDVADWLRIDINANTNPSRSQVDNMIIMNQELFDQETGHSWQTNRVYDTEQLDANDQWVNGKGMPLYLKHRRLKPYDSTKGDKIEIWNGDEWVLQTVTDNSFFHFDTVNGILYVRGYVFSLFRHGRFRVTYRYGGSSEGRSIPKDIKKALILMTSIDILSTDFKMSQIGYGGEGNVNKKDIMEKWDAMVKKTIWNRSEIQSVW